MQGQKTLSLFYNMHLFLYNDSQMIRVTIHFSKPLLCVMLICGDWSISCPFHNKSSIYERSAALFTAVTGKTAILLLQRRHLVAKNEFAFSSRPMQKSSFPRSARTTSVNVSD